MTPERIREIEGAANAASEGPWKVDRVPFEGPHKPREPADVQGPCGLIVTCESGYDNQAANCRFIASARTDVPELVAEVKRLQGEVERLKNEAHHSAIVAKAAADSWIAQEEKHRKEKGR